MPTKVMKSIKGRVARVTRLDECGIPVVGACSSIVTDGFISVELSPEQEDGEEFLIKNADGAPCINEFDTGFTKWVTANVELCAVNPHILDIVGGANPLMDTETEPQVIGASWGTDQNLSGFGLEVWTRIAGAACTAGVQDWGYFVIPFLRDGMITDSMTIENDALTVSLTGRGVEAPADWGVGPYGDNPLIAPAGFPVGDLWAQVVTTVQPPAADPECQAIA